MPAPDESRTGGQETPAFARSVLIVDDEAGVRDVLRRWLEAGGYRVNTAGDAQEALARLDRSPSAVALCDIRMPGHDGLWLAERIRQQFPETAIIMATGVPSDAPAEPSEPSGVVDYLTKPFGRDRLHEAVFRGLEWHHAARDARHWRQTLEQELTLRRERLTAAVTAVVIDSDSALDALLTMLMAHDRELLAHARRVAEMGAAVALALGAGVDEQALVRRAGLVHDLGKLAVPEAILRKPAPLTSGERSLMRMHASIGGELAASVPHVRDAAPLVRDLRERVDGGGYPRGLPAMDGPLGARILSAVEAYDVMTRPRVYRDPLGRADALLELARCSGTQFDPRVVGVLQRIV